MKIVRKKCGGKRMSVHKEHSKTQAV